MKPLQPKCAQALDSNLDWTLFLDFDGTILHFADTPDGVAPSARAECCAG
jgi:trehalose-6-phosphatase